MPSLLSQELRQLEQMQKTSQNTRRDTSFTLNESTDGESRIKSEYVLLERKYERLVQKEKRLQVWVICINGFLMY